MTDKTNRLSLTATQVYSATESLSEIVKSSTASGWPEVAASALTVNITIINHADQTDVGSTATFTEAEFRALQSQVETLDERLKAKLDPATITKNCRENYDECREKGKGLFNEAKCLTEYFQCLRAVTPKGDKHLHL